MTTNWTVFMPLRATTEWLAFTPKQRFAWVRQTIEPLLEQHPQVRLRFFDAEFFTAQVSDVAMWETSDLDAWRALVEGLRETAFWGRYFEVCDVWLTVENAYAEHYAEIAVSG